MNMRHLVRPGELNKRRNLHLVFWSLINSWFNTRKILF